MSHASILALQLAAQRESGRLHPLPPEIPETVAWRLEDELRSEGFVAGRRAVITPKGYREIARISQQDRPCFSTR